MITNNYPSSDRIILFDFANFVFVCYYSNPDDYIRIFKSRFYAVLNSYKGNVTPVIAIDHTPHEKKKQLVSYKKDREQAKVNPFPACFEFIDTVEHVKIEKDGEEADDVIFSFCDNNQDLSIDVITRDKDIYQVLEYKNVNVWNPVSCMYVKRHDLSDLFGVNTWDKIALHKAVKGDPSDKIPSAKLRLNKNKLLNVINDCDGTIDDFFNKFNKIVTSPKILERFEKNKNIIIRNYNIIKLKNNLDYIERFHFP